MSSIPIGVIGADRYADELLQHQAPLPGIRLADWAPMPDDCDHTRVAELAQAAGARCADSWQGLIEDSRLDAILVLGEISSRIVPIAAALPGGQGRASAVPCRNDAGDFGRSRRCAERKHRRADGFR